MKNKILAPILFVLFTLPFSGAGGAYVWRDVVCALAKIEQQTIGIFCSMNMRNIGTKMPAKLLMSFKISVVLSLLVMILPALVILAAMFAKPKRELHGSSRFANLLEVQQAGLLKSEAERKKDKPDLLIGKYKNRFFADGRAMNFCIWLRPHVQAKAWGL